MLISIEYIGGELQSLRKLSGGYSSDELWTLLPDLARGDTGGVTRPFELGAGPVGQIGRCLFGIGVGVRGRLLRFKAGVGGGGVEECRSDCCCTTTVAMTIVAVDCYFFSQIMMNGVQSPGIRVEGVP